MSVSERWKIKIPDGYRIFEREFPISGVQHHKQNFFKVVKKGNAEFRMQAEPKNQHDPNAIAVLGARKSLFGRVEKKIGYIPAEIASQLGDAELYGQVALRPKSLYISDSEYIELKFDLLGPKELYEKYTTV